MQIKDQISFLRFALSDRGGKKRGFSWKETVGIPALSTLRSVLQKRVGEGRICALLIIAVLCLASAQVVQAQIRCPRASIGSCLGQGQGANLPWSLSYTLDGCAEPGVKGLTITLTGSANVGSLWSNGHCGDFDRSAIWVKIYWGDGNYTIAPAPMGTGGDQIMRLAQTMYTYDKDNLKCNFSLALETWYGHPEEPGCANIAVLQGMRYLSRTAPQNVTGGTNPLTLSNTEPPEVNRVLNSRIDATTEGFFMDGADRRSFLLCPGASMPPTTLSGSMTKSACADRRFVQFEYGSGFETHGIPGARMNNVEVFLPGTGWTLITATRFDGGVNFTGVPGRDLGTINPGNDGFLASTPQVRVVPSTDADGGAGRIFVVTMHVWTPCSPPSMTGNTVTPTVADRDKSTKFPL